MPNANIDSELDAVAARFGVARAQVERDRLISHLLAGLDGLDVVFFGGTALSRTLLPDLRLSEDIDLISVERRGPTAQDVERAMVRAVQRSFGAAAWTPPLTTVRDVDPAVFTVADLSVRVQLLDSVGYPSWPTEVMKIEQRYSDAPGVNLRVLTPSAFVAAKTSAWYDRHAPRDLYDLWALAEAGYVTTQAADLYRRFGPTARTPDARTFADLPSADEWEAALAHQGRIAVGTTEAAARVLEAWRSLES